MSPQDAANMWKTYLEPLKAANPNLRLGSPAPSSRPNGIQWIWDFLGNCNGGCTVDFIALRESYSFPSMKAMQYSAHFF